MEQTNRAQRGTVTRDQQTDKITNYAEAKRFI